MNAYQVFTISWGKGHAAYLAGKPKSFVVANWSDAEMALSTQDLNEINPAFASFYIGTHQHLVEEKARFAQALCDSLNNHRAAVANLTVKV